MNFEYLDSITANYAYAIKALCETYNLKPDDLCTFRYDNFILSAIVEGNFVRPARRVPVSINIPEQCAPRVDGSRATVPTVAIDFYPLPDQASYDRTHSGLYEFRLLNPDQNCAIQEREYVRFWKWNIESDHLLGFVVFCEKTHLQKFYRHLLTIMRRVSQNVLPPILPKGMLHEIYENSIGFLLKGKDEKLKYEKYSIPYKRGILLCGKPGCGKTLSCKWLRLLAIQHGFNHKVITLQDYEEAKTHGHMRSLFSMPKTSPGIIFFDDMDVMVKDRNQSGHHDLMNFLTHLDGINSNEGVVYVFTTNFLKELDEAFVRPGRIDLFLTFKVPTAKLRKQFIEERFHEDLKKFFTIENMVERTKDYSFAEIEEVRKLLAIDLINERKISIDRIFEIFEHHRKDFADREKFGFGRLGTESEDDEDEYAWWPPGIPVPDGLIPTPPMPGKYF